MFGINLLARTETRVLREKVARLQGAQRWRRAHRVWSELIRRHPRDPLLRLRMGECLRHLKKPLEAETSLFEAARLWTANEQWAHAIAALRLIEQLTPSPETSRRIIALEARRRLARRSPLTARLLGDERRGSPRPVGGLGDVEGWTHRVAGVTEATGGRTAPPLLLALPAGEAPRAESPKESDLEGLASDAMPEAVFETLYAGFSSSQRPAAEEIEPRAGDWTDRFLPTPDLELPSGDDFPPARDARSGTSVARV